MTYSQGIVDLLRTPEPFSLWLRDLEPLQPAGLCHSATRCPLARFLEGQGIVAGVGISRINFNSVSLPTPSWARRFVMTVDCGVGIRPITASECMVALRAIEADLQIVEKTDET